MTNLYFKTISTLSKSVSSTPTARPTAPPWCLSSPRSTENSASSGRIFNRQQTIDVLLKSGPRPATISNYYVERLAENAALATYRATTALAISHRSSLWVFRDNRWQLLFHQGTIAD